MSKKRHVQKAKEIANKTVNKATSLFSKVSDTMVNWKKAILRQFSIQFFLFIIGQEMKEITNLQLKAAYKAVKEKTQELYREGVPFIQFLDSLQTWASRIDDPTHKRLVESAIQNTIAKMVKRADKEPNLT